MSHIWVFASDPDGITTAERLAWEIVEYDALGGGSRPALLTWSFESRARWLRRANFPTPEAFAEYISGAEHAFAPGTVAESAMLGHRANAALTALGYALDVVTPAEVRLICPELEYQQDL